MVAVQQRSRSVTRQTSLTSLGRTSLGQTSPWPASAVEVVSVPIVGRRTNALPAPALRATNARRVSPSTYRRRQALAAGAVAVLTAASSLVLGALGGGSLTAPERPLPVVAGHVYEVQPGDTFWAIARSLDPAGDPRPLVDRLVAEHGSPLLMVGEQLLLPAAP